LEDGGDGAEVPHFDESVVVAGNENVVAEELQSVDGRRMRLSDYVGDFATPVEEAEAPILAARSQH
jgi:hypothetical protein